MQHEYGIFGGPAGSHLLKLLGDLRMPMVTTLHTVLKDPAPEYRAVMSKLSDLSDKLVVMSHKASDFLKDIYGVPEEKIVFIHHGIPDTPFIDSSFYKDKFGVEGKKVLLTFGLLSPNKGKEVSRKYLQVFNEVRQNRTRNPRPRHSYVENIKAITNFELPEINLDHMKAFTDDTGILQHANYTIPDRAHGYCTDDNASALPAAENFRSPRAIAFCLVGIHAYLNKFSGDSDVRRIRNVLADRLFDQLSNQATDDWPWLENSLNYANGKLPHALLISGQRMQRDEMIDMGLKALKWLLAIQTENKHFVPIGNNGWYKKGGLRARFDQQPVEANAMVEACVEAFNTTRDQSDHVLQLVSRGHDVTLFAIADFQTSGRLHAVCPRGYEEDHALIPKVWECLHISELFEDAGSYDIIHNQFDSLPLTYTGMTNTPVVTTIHGFSSPGILPVYKKYNGNVFYVSISDADRSPDLDYIKTIFEQHLNAVKNYLPPDAVLDDVRKSLIGAYFTKEYSIEAAALFNPSIVPHPDHRVSERVIFPVSKNESRGIEDARFVQFIDDRQKTTYYATYTAYTGHTILPQLIETKDFIKFNIVTLNGKAIKNKGMALSPRKIGGRYAMLSRQDGENNHIMFSDNIHFWQTSQIIQEPEYPWEFIQIGNCGSSLETDQGWIVLTHGVGPMRQYCIGAILLDLDNPSKIIARLDAPLLSPHEKEREGYVPNVVYSCGAIIHNRKLVIPYAMSDINSGIATVSICGEMAGRVDVIPKLLRSGTRSLSVASALVPDVKLVVRKIRKERIMMTLKAVDKIRLKMKTLLDEKMLEGV